MDKEQYLSLYIHFPFCVRKCRYCDFLSFPEEEDVREAYVRALLTEIRLRGQELAGRPVRTVFIGGGTPSLMSSDQLSRIMEAVFQSFDVKKDAEISMECNPGTVGEFPAGKAHSRAGVSAGKSGDESGMYGKEMTFSDIRRCGINRLSLGLQSADDGELAVLGRIHTFDQFLKSFHAAREAGFANINIDLMSGLPGQTPVSWLQTLQRVSALEPEHISAYSLIIEEGTPFWEIYGESRDDPDPQTGKGMQVRVGKPGSGSAAVWPSLPDEDAERQMYANTHDFLREVGYEHYEISNFSLPGYHSRHNSSYWDGTPYLGLGAAAHSYDRNVRRSNPHDLHAYISCIAAGKTACIEEEMTLWERYDERVMLSLRTAAGMDVECLRQEFGDELAGHFLHEVQRHIAAGNIRREGDSRYVLTTDGILLSDSVMRDLMWDA